LKILNLSTLKLVLLPGLFDGDILTLDFIVFSTVFCCILFVFQLYFNR